MSITGFGRDEPWAAWVGLGDDAAAGAGLVAWDAGGPLFCADAVADPLAGLAAAARAIEVLGGPEVTLLDVSLHAAAAEVFGGPAPHHGWTPIADAPLPRARPIRGEAPGVGEHNGEVFAAVARAS